MSRYRWVEWNSIRWVSIDFKKDIIVVVGVRGSVKSNTKTMELFGFRRRQSPRCSMSTSTKQINFVLWLCGGFWNVNMENLWWLEPKTIFRPTTKTEQFEQIFLQVNAKTQLLKKHQNTWIRWNDFSGNITDLTIHRCSLRGELFVDTVTTSKCSQSRPYTS